MRIQEQKKQAKTKSENGTHSNELYQLLNQKKTSYAKRGMDLEEDINQSNDYYREKKVAFIYKKPTPIRLVKVDYPTKNGSVTAVKIKEAYFEAPSTTDYNGIYLGKYIDFEAKETQSTTSFPLDNIHPHQIEHLRNITICGGIGFIIVRFTLLRKTYLLEAKDFFDYIENHERKSIPLTYFQEQGHPIEEGFRPKLNYLKIVEEIIGGGKCDKNEI